MKCFKEWPAALQRRWALLISAGRAGIRKYRRVRLLLSDGTEKDVLIDKHTSLRVGNSCRIHLRCSSSSSAPSDLPGEYWTGDGFLCLENLGRSSAD